MSLPALQPPDLNQCVKRLDANDRTLRVDILNALREGPLWLRLTQSTSFTYPSDKERFWRAIRPLDDQTIWAGFRDHLLTHRIDIFDALATSILLKAHAPLSWARWIELLPALKDECRAHETSARSSGAWFVDTIWTAGALPPVNTALDRQLQATLLYAFLVDLDGPSRVRANLANYRDEPIVDIARRLLPADDPWWHSLDLLGLSDELLVEALRVQVEPTQLPCPLPEGIASP